ncbi:MAG: heparan-alpha-glucosaminide N-acetyltransferase domain-containing protein [Bacteroidota bacterium]
MKERINSIDIVRGLIMVIMTLDHSRDFLHFAGHPPLDLASTTPILFFTRWITHFCAPTFVFLSGVSAYLAGQRRTKKELSAFLFKRGLWLILSDSLLISLIFSFDLQYHMLILEVLWATGFGMILLALLIRAPLKVIGVIAVIIFFGHDLLNYVTLPNDGLAGALSKMLLSARGVFIPLSETRAIIVLYAVMPWAGALLMGYVFGSLYKGGFEPTKRSNILRLAGSLAVVLFIVLRLINHYGDPMPWSPQKDEVFSFLSFINATKQSPSLDFLLMTLGPVLILLSYTEKVGGHLFTFFKVYGSVPYLYFIIHLALLRIVNILLAMVMGIPMVSDGSPIVWQVKGFGVSLWAVYAVWLAVVLALYYPCRWYGKYKQTHSNWWLSYL